MEGVSSGMCEAHICETIRRAFPDAKRVKASRKKKEAAFIFCESENYAKKASSVDTQLYNKTPAGIIPTGAFVYIRFPYLG